MSETDKIVALIDKAVAKITHPTEVLGGAEDGAATDIGTSMRTARDEMWVAAAWIMRQEPTAIPDILDRISEDPRRAYLFLNGVLLCFSSLEKQIEDIQEGIPWEAEGETFTALTAFEIQVLKGEVKA